MRLKLIPLLLCLLPPTSALAQLRPDPYSDSTTIPQTPAYGRAVEVVELLNQGDPDAFEAYARSTFAGPFLDEIPMAEHRAVFVEMRRDNGPMQVHGARTYDPPRPDSRATLIVWSTWLESWRPAPPSDLPKAEVLTDEQIAEVLAGYVDRS